jgi:hypothetical protein
MWGNIEWFKDGISTGQFGIAFNTLLPGQHYAVYTSGFYFLELLDITGLTFYYPLVKK